MSIFTRPSENQAKLYIKGLDKGDMRIDNEDKLKAVIKVTVGEDGKLYSKGQPISFLRSLLVSLPDELVSYGYPHTVLAEKGSTLNIRPSMWLFLDEDVREDMVGFFAEQEFDLTIREFRTLTR
jgi:hypothetical protein